MSEMKYMTRELFINNLIEKDKNLEIIVDDEITRFEVKSTIVDFAQNIVAPGLTQTIHFTSNDDKKIKNLIEKIDPNLNNWYITSAHEGTFVRLYNFDNYWHLSTTKSINAYKSYWGSRFSFGKIFDKYVNAVEKQKKLVNKFENENDSQEKFLKNLDPTKIYYFLLETTKMNRIVSYNSAFKLHDRLKFIGVEIHNEDNSFTFISSHTYLKSDNEKESLSAIRIPDYYFLTSCEDLISLAAKKQVGLYLSHKDNKAKIKILNYNYKIKFDLRGNEPFLFKRFLVIKLYSPEILTQFIDLYPYQYAIFISEYETLLNYAKFIEELYIDKYIKKILSEKLSCELCEFQNNNLTIKVLEDLNDLSKKDDSTFKLDSDTILKIICDQPWQNVIKRLKSFNNIQ